MSAKLTVMNNGSIRVEGEFELFDMHGSKFSTEGKERISLCRCGQSQKKPFCDGTHKTSGFESEIIAQ